MNREEIEKMIRIERISTLSGISHVREIDITEEQLSALDGDGLIQNICPHLSADDREFLISGITPDEWDAAFAEDEGGDPADDEPAF